MFILRGPKYIKRKLPDGTFSKHSGKPDGMMVRDSDDLFTDNKQAAKLFTTATEAADYHRDVLSKSTINYDNMFVVEVETKPVVKSCSKTATVVL